MSDSTCLSINCNYNYRNNNKVILLGYPLFFLFLSYSILILCEKIAQDKAETGGGVLIPRARMWSNLCHKVYMVVS